MVFAGISQSITQPAKYSQEPGFLEYLSVDSGSSTDCVVDHIGPITLMAIPVVKPNSHDLDILSGPTWSVDSDVCSRWEEKMCGMPPVGTPGNTYRLRGYFRHLLEHLGYW